MAERPEADLGRDAELTRLVRLEGERLDREELARLTAESKKLEAKIRRLNTRYNVNAGSTDQVQANLNIQTGFMGSRTKCGNGSENIPENRLWNRDRQETGEQR